MTATATPSTAPHVGTSTQARSPITGSVRYVGAVPASKRIDMSKDKNCAALNPNFATQEVIAPGGDLKDVFVYVSAGLPPEARYPIPDRAIVLDQKGCWYSPTVLGVQVGQALELVNSDHSMHNVHAFAKRGDFNVAMPVYGQRVAKKFLKEEIMVSIKCEVHPWMQAWVGVVDHPFFSVTDAAGRYQIPGLPPGKYTLSFWHAALGSQSSEVEVRDEHPAQADVVFKAKSSS